MERKLDTLDEMTVSIKYLKDQNLLWFFYASKIFSQFDFKVNKDQYSLCEILLPENKINVYPLLIDLMKKKKIKLKDLMDYYINSKESEMTPINEKLSLILQTMRNKVKVTKDSSLIQ